MWALTSAFCLSALYGLLNYLGTRLLLQKVAR
jgi:hypothetical protein